MPQFDKQLRAQRQRGVDLCLDGFDITNAEIESAGHPLDCCRTSGMPCTPPGPDRMQRDGFTTQGLPDRVASRIRSFRYGCTQARRRDWNGPPCSASHPINYDARPYRRTADAIAQGLNVLGWDSGNTASTVATPSSFDGAGLSPDDGAQSFRGPAGVPEDVREFLGMLEWMARHYPAEFRQVHANVFSFVRVVTSEHGPGEEGFVHNVTQPRPASHHVFASASPHGQAPNFTPAQYVIDMPSQNASNAPIPGPSRHPAASSVGPSQPQNQTALSRNLNHGEATGDIPVQGRSGWRPSLSVDTTDNLYASSSAEPLSAQSMSAGVRDPSASSVELTDSLSQYLRIP